MSIAEIPRYATVRLFPEHMKITRGGTSLWMDPEDQIEGLIEQLEKEPITPTPATSSKMMSRGRHRKRNS